jgi:hypothetical protein
MLGIGVEAMLQIPNQPSGWLRAARDLLGWTSTQAVAVILCSTKNFTVLKLKVEAVLNGEIA